MTQVLPLTPSLKSDELQLSICYARSHISPGGPIDLALVGAQASDSVLGQHVHDNRMAQRSALTFAMVLFGSQHGCSALVNQGYVLHGAVLKQLNAALTGADCYLRDEVLLSIASLSLLESLVPSGPRNYLNHMMGLQRLLELRDPGMQCSTVSKGLYQAVRHMMLFASLKTGTASIFAENRWKVALRAACATAVEIEEQELYDFLADATALQAERNEWTAFTSNCEALDRQRMQIYDRTTNVLSQLREWRTSWAADGRNAYFETNATKGHHDVEGPPVGPIYIFSNATSALNLMLYNTTRIYLLRILASLVTDEPETQYTSVPSETFTSYTSERIAFMAKSAALDVCRCVTYYSNSRLTSAAPLHPTFHWALSTAWETLHGNLSQEGRWISNLQRPDGRSLIARAVLAD